MTLKEARNSVRSDTGVRGRNPSPLNEHRLPEEKLQPPWPKQKGNDCIIRELFSSPGSLSFKAELMKKASGTRKDNRKERGRFMHFSTSTAPSKDVLEDRRIPAGGGQPSHATSAH